MKSFLGDAGAVGFFLNEGCRGLPKTSTPTCSLKALAFFRVPYFWFPWHASLEGRFVGPQVSPKAQNSILIGLRALVSWFD